MANERITEDIVRDHFKNDPLYDVIKVEEQKSNNKNIMDLLKNASKSGKGIGKPEFIITFPSVNSDYLMVIECKADVTKHQSKNLTNIKDCAVDGVLHYGKILSSDYNVISIAVSGQNERELKISTFIHRKKDNKSKDTKNKKLLTINDYLNIFDDDIFSENIKNIDIVQKAVYLNEELHSYSVTEYLRCTVISAILIGLQDKPFRDSYKTFSKSKELGEGLTEAIKRALGNKLLKNRDSMLSEFQKILSDPLFVQDKINRTNKIKKKKEENLTIEILKNIISYIQKNIYPLILNNNSSTDVLGKFYTEFIRYASSSQKQGLVLTPAHITDFFCDLANITKNSIVYDPCCGSSGFLISAMKRMLVLAKDDNKKKNNIKANQLIGVERRPDMFTYACTNMMFRGDGKANIYNGDCYSLEKTIMENHNIDTVFLNPPYDVGNVGQLEFVEHGLKITKNNNGIVIAIVQMSCGIKNENELIAIKERLLFNHRLKAVISVPNDVFYPIGVVTCIMVWKANKPNDGFETWLGYLKDDGFEKRKHKGRIDIKNKWNAIKKNFLNAYKNNNEIAGLSVKKEIQAQDDWCVEAYMETDYSILTEEKFIKTIKNYVAFQFLNENK